MHTDVAIVYTICTHMCTFMHTQVETRGGHYVTCSTTLCCTLLTQSLSLNLEVGRPAAPSDPSVSALHSTRATGMYKAMPRFLYGCWGFGFRSWGLCSKQ